MYGDRFWFYTKSRIRCLGGVPPQVVVVAVGFCLTPVTPPSARFIPCSEGGYPPPVLVPRCGSGKLEISLFMLQKGLDQCLSMPPQKCSWCWPGLGGLTSPSVRGVGRAGGLTSPTKMRVVVGLAGILGGLNPPQHSPRHILFSSCTYVLLVSLRALETP